MCYDTIDKSGFCDGLHPGLVTYQFQPLDDGTLACTDCSGEDLLNKQRSDEEVACHCKVIGQNARNQFDLFRRALVTSSLLPALPPVGIVLLLSFRLPNINNLKGSIFSSFNLNASYF